jgi:hypothetical protein
MAGDCQAFETWGLFMSDSVTYRASAEVCAKLAADVDDPYAKVVLLNMAEGWLRLATYVERRQQNEVREHFGAEGLSDQDVNPNG